MAIYLSSATVADEDELEGGVLLLFGSHGVWAIGDAIGEGLRQQISKTEVESDSLTGLRMIWTKATPGTKRRGGRG